MSQLYTIRAIEPSDAAAIHRILACPGVYPNTTQLPCQPLSAVQKRLESNGSNVHTLVACNAQGEVVGYGGLIVSERARLRHSASLFLAIHDDWQGRGVGKALMAAILNLADNWLGLIRVELKVNHDNDRAIALYERCGFEYEGRARCEVLRNGEYIDSLMMARLRLPGGGS